MGLNISFEETKPVQVFSKYITHNLSKMALEFGLYEALWHPESIGIVKAYQLIDILERGLVRLDDGYERAKAFEPENGYGTYYGFVNAVKDILKACKDNPESNIIADR